MKKEFLLILSYLIFFISPIASILIATGVLVFADFITTYFANRKKDGKANLLIVLDITIAKTFFYFILIILSRIMEIFFIPYIPFAAITSGYIALREFKGNIENVDIILGQNLWQLLNKKISQLKK